MKTLTYIVAGLISLLFLRCTEENLGTQGTQNTPDLRALSAEELEVVQTSNQFAYELFKAVHTEKKQESIFISPLSVNIALQMAVNGAREETRGEMKQTLGVDHLSDEEANTAIRDLTQLLLAMDRKVDISIANAIWYKEQLTLQPDFTQLIAEYYDGKIEGLDFGNPAAKDVINKWIEDKTRGKIREMIDDISQDEVMFLVNAIYFKADWTYQFEKSQTKEEDFKLEDGSQVKVPMMFSKGVTLHHFANETLQLMDIPYGNGQFSMTVLLPNPDKNTEDVMEALNAESFQQWISQADSITPQLYLPKFTLEFKLDNMADILSDMGMGSAFVGGANFSGFFEEELPLALSRVIHEGVIEVNEEGSEAAAATVVGVQLTSSLGGSDPLTIKVDRPFVFMIREKHSGAILFAGKMLDPTENN